MLVKIYYIFYMLTEVCATHSFNVHKSPLLLEAVCFYNPVMSEGSSLKNLITAIWLQGYCMVAIEINRLSNIPYLPEWKTLYVLSVLSNWYQYLSTFKSPKSGHLSRDPAQKCPQDTRNTPKALTFWQGLHNPHPFSSLVCEIVLRKSGLLESMNVILGWGTVFY